MAQTAVEKLISTIYAHPKLSREEKDELFNMADKAIREVMKERI
jgi:hypothetical protein